MINTINQLNFAQDLFSLADLTRCKMLQNESSHEIKNGLQYKLYYLKTCIDQCRDFLADSIYV